MYNVVGVRFKKAGKIYYFDPVDFALEKDDYVIVETARGVEYGKVVVPIKQVEEHDVVLPLKQVVRPSTDKDRIQVEENRLESAQALALGTDKIIERNLEMKLVDVEYTFDRNKIIFYFTAEGRVDFRDLVKDLASVFRTRIELRQIGVRDEAKMLGGIGPCGRMLCCSTFLGDFEPVSIKMAKDQNLSLNPSKISGLCGRLMCCLKYENDEYETAREQMPDIGDKVETPDGLGRVVSMNILERILRIELPDPQRVLDYTLEEITNHATNQVQWSGQ
ncbi:Cell fate regulator YaaT, PSP1 superfamily (controls sporulation, competence, biofilm development) [Paenisporosarcina quisquiliarum]|uniref:Stage 0 sporulation family protein n=1 Tax=Psychrobacillus psychrodurans TaxID=126157 RepID=A0A9X3RCM2_9BACI|nr:stage 0 sporulation family protein [Psychrobacillus psychrodurans]SEN94644.1 Cell fate regulator YaaT, PSP1 superfamily (controls sporulation, competence, biofilm development) [Paenisporosarcina quisquiliarum]MCK1999555.1 stage 0 sporulation family protein [Psychrobacillus psychrodurans]MCZ8535533.1 stage 0 sporulation family protein [Psychrobacillus psychrodurans]MCZ8542053.1 stage 0 sporulation family protein [Psychrobacillus psychrodurans]SFN15637.1 Cell fate regulator YaaT, PSP1 superfa